MASAGAVSLLLDIIPAAAGILLLIAFIAGRRGRKAEEEKLKQMISTFERQAAGEEKTGKREEHE